MVLIQSAATSPLTVLLPPARGRPGTPTRSWTWLALAWLAATSLPGGSVVSASQTYGNRIPAARASSEHFIAAFDLTPKQDFRFTWPPDSMRPAPYETVLLVVEKMPHVWNPNGHERRSNGLRARDHLRINGQPANALAIVQGQHQIGSAEERFLVKLEQGRLRIRLTIPPDLAVDPLHSHARIRVYRYTGRD